MPREGPLPGNAREGREAALRREARCGQHRHAREPHRHARRTAGDPGSGCPQVVTVTRRQVTSMSSCNSGACAPTRVAIVATGSELVRGDHHDRNGPFLAHASSHSASIPRGSRSSATIPPTSRRHSAKRSGRPLCRVRGPGADHDDRTVEMVARAAGVGWSSTRASRREIEAVSRSYAERWAGRMPIRPWRAEAGDPPRGRDLPSAWRERRRDSCWKTEPAAVVVLPRPSRGSSSGYGLAALETAPVRTVLERARHREREGRFASTA